jgi:opacity protein-like surface antigen
MEIRPGYRFASALAISWLVASLGTAWASAESSDRSYSFEAGYWVPTEGLLRDVLGGGVTFGGTVSLPLHEGRWIDFGLGYWRKSGDFPPLEDETLPGALTYRRSEVTLVPLSLSFRAEGTAQRGIRPFVRGGVDLNAVKESVHFRQTHPTKPVQQGTNSISNAFLGFHFSGGAEKDLNPRTSLLFQVTVSVVNADTEGVGGLVAGGVSLGGIGFLAGLRYR